MTKKKKIKNVVTLENLMVFLNQNPRINLEIGKAFFDCPFCKEEALVELEGVLCKSGLENVKHSDVAFGTIIFDLETKYFSCTSWDANDIGDEHAFALEEKMVEFFLPGVSYDEYLDAKWKF